MKIEIDTTLKTIEIIDGGNVLELTEMLKLYPDYTICPTLKWQTPIQPYPQQPIQPFYGDNFRIDCGNGTGDYFHHNVGTSKEVFLDVFTVTRN